MQITKLSFFDSISIPFWLVFKKILKLSVTCRADGNFLRKNGIKGRSHGRRNRWVGLFSSGASGFPISHEVRRPIFNFFFLQKLNLLLGNISGDEPEAVAEDAQVVEDLPLANDYTGIGGPQTVPLESEGAFEKPSALGQGYRLLNDLFMAPSQDTIKSFQFTERKRLM